MNCTSSQDPMDMVLYYWVVRVAPSGRYMFWAWNIHCRGHHINDSNTPKRGLLITCKSKNKNHFILFLLSFGTNSGPIGSWVNDTYRRLFLVKQALNKRYSWLFFCKQTSDPGKFVPNQLANGFSKCHHSSSSFNKWSSPWFQISSFYGIYHFNCGSWNVFRFFVF